MCRRIYSHEITESVLCGLFEHLENETPAMVCKANLSADSSCHYIVRSRSEQDFEYAIFRNPNSDPHNDCADLTGLITAYGFWPYLEHSLRKAALHMRLEMRRMTKEYMSYILFCGSQSPDWLKLGELMSSGADIFQYFYPNVRFPVRYSAASRIVGTLINNPLGNLVARHMEAQTAFLHSILASTDQDVHHALFVLGFTCFDSNILGTAVNYTHGVIVEIEILSFLRCYLVATEIVGTTQNPTFCMNQVINALNTSMGRVLLVCSNDTYRFPDTESLERFTSMTFEPRQSSLVPQTAEESCPDAFSDAFSPDREAWFEEQIEMLYNNSTVEVDAWEYIKEIGYGKERSDPEILRWPIQKFEDVEEDALA